MRPCLTRASGAAPALALLVLTACAHVSLARDEGTHPESQANSWSQANSHVELTSPAKGYYLSSSKRRAGAAFGDRRPYLLVNVGNENPLLAFSSIDFLQADYNPDAPYARCRRNAPPGEQRCPYTIELSAPVAFNLFWDAFTSDAPIVDTDYTFGFDLTGRVAVANATELRTRAYWGHISTHIGDEYFNGARRDTTHRFPRINPSYFPWRLGGSVRHYGGNASLGTFRSWLELGAQLEGSCLFGCDAHGYYGTDTSQTDGVPIDLIPNGVEYNVTLDWKHYRTVSSGLGTQRRPSSIDAALLVGRRRVFPYLNPPLAHAYDPVVNAVVGYTFSQGIPGIPGSVELYGRGYRGPNPYGQLRNQRHFDFLALGLRFH